MELLKYTFGHVRKASKQIYKGFDLKHLDNVTKHYVHIANQSANGSTTISQSVGEAVNLFCDLIKSIKDKAPIGEVWFDDERTQFLLDITIPDDWKDEKVFEKKIANYKALIISNSIQITAYDSKAIRIDDDMEHMHPLYKTCICVMAVLARDFITDTEYHINYQEYIDNQDIVSFVTACEDLYQRNKNYNFKIIYSDLNKYEHLCPNRLSENLDIARSISPKPQKAKQEPAIIKFQTSEFSSEQLEYIPCLSEEFVLEGKLHGLCSAITNSDARSVLFHGPAGTGKTINCKLICQEIGLPIMETINCTENLDEYVLGKYIPLDDKIIFKESFVTKAIRDGGAVVFEEINFAKPQYLAFLNSLLDDNGFVRLDNGDVVKRHKNFRFFATMNIGYLGTKDLNQALYNRFNAIVEVSQLSDTAIKRMLTARVPECSNLADQMINVYHKIQKKIEAEELDVVISPRTLENWARMAKYEGYLTSADKTIVSVAKNDKSLADIIRSVISIYKWE